MQYGGGARPHTGLWSYTTERSQPQTAWRSSGRYVKYARGQTRTRPTFTITTGQSGYRRTPWRLRGYKPKGSKNNSSGNKNIGSKSKMARTRNRRRNKKRGVIRRIPVPLGFDNHKLVRMRVAHKGSASGATNVTPLGFVMKANGLADPFQTTGSEQPMGLDEWSNFYNKYAIIGAKVKIMCHNSGAYAVAVGTYEGDESTLLSDAEHYREHKTTQVKILTPDVDHCYLTNTYSPKRSFHVRKITDEADHHGSLTTTGSPTDPTKARYFHYFAQRLNGGADTCSVEHLITIEYLVLLFDPKTLDRST